MGQKITEGVHTAPRFGGEGDVIGRIVHLCFLIHEQTF
jgi:hypothetical protein